MNKDSFVSIEDLTDKDWAQIEDLAKQVLKTGVFKDNPIRSAVAAFVLWLSENQVGLAVEEPESPKKRASRLQGLH